MAKTSAGAFATRSARLKALDATIRTYDRAASVESATPMMKDDIYRALSAYLAEEESRYGIEAWKRSARNKDRIFEDLVTAVSGSLTASLAQVENFAEWPVPTVVEPAVVIPPPPPQLMVDQRLEKAAEQWTVSGTISRVPNQSAGASSGISLPTDGALLLRKIDALYTDLVHLKGQVNSKLHMAEVHFVECVKKGFNDFKELHRLAAEDTAFTVSLVGHAFGALSKMPFPFSVVGSIGKAVVGLATTDTHWSSLTVEMPTPGGFVGKIGKQVAAFNEFRNLNVSPKKLEGQEQLVFRFFTFFSELKDTVDATFESETAGISDEAKRLQLFMKRVGTIGTNPSPAEVQRHLQLATNEISDLGIGIKTQFAPLTKLAHIKYEQTAIWVTVQLIADYAVTGLCAGKDVTTMTVAELGKVNFGAPFAKFLASEDVGILKLKEASGASSGIYGGGRIPWDGSSNHVIAVMLYLDWFRRTLNPFDLLRQEVTPTHFQHWSAAYIRNLGSAMAAHKATAFEHVSGIQDATTAASKYTVASGGDIGDAFKYGL